MEVEDTGLPGCFLVRPRVITDNRGSFVKTFHAPDFEALSLRTDWKEEYCSSSRVGVVRGMHFQLPPADHAKLVYCVGGEVLDVVLDLRHGSPTQGQHRSFTLSAENGMGLYIPTGCAHGFVATRSPSAMYYKVTSVHSPDHDSGIAWNSFGFDWPTEAPVISDRDRRHLPLPEFETPFVFDPKAPAR